MPCFSRKSIENDRPLFSSPTKISGRKRIDQGIDEMKMLCRFYHPQYLSALLLAYIRPAHGSGFNRGRSPSLDMEFGLYLAFFTHSGQPSVLASALEPEINGDKTSLEVFS